MKVSRMEKAFVLILMIIFGGIVLHAPLSVSLGVLFPDFSLIIKSWKEILMLIAMSLVVIIVTKRGMWQELLRDWIFRIICLYVALHLLLSILFHQGMTATIAGLAIDLRYILFFGLVYVAIKLLPRYRHTMLVIGTMGACIVVGFATLQVFLPPDILSYIGYSKDTIIPYLTVDKNPDFVRVNSTLRGPNPVGAYAGMVLGLLAAALVRRKLDLKNKKVATMTIVFAICSGVALWVSYSRSALVAGLVTVLVVVFVTVLRKLSSRAWIISCVVLFTIAGALILGRDSSFVSNVLLHENLSGGSEISSNDDHIASLDYGVNQLIQRPLGAGIGSTGSASLHGDSPVIIENQYFFVAHEVGWLGLGLFLAIFLLVLRRLWRARTGWLSLGVFASGIGLGLIGLLLPVWADDTVSIIWWGLAAIALAGGSYARKQTKQKTK